jgi:hypothetical protein
MYQAIHILKEHLIFQPFDQTFAVLVNYDITEKQYLPKIAGLGNVTNKLKDTYFP